MEQADQLREHVPLGQHIVGGHAGLACVEQLPEEDPPGGQGEIRVTGHDHRALAAKLQGHRGETGGGPLHDDAAHRGTSGEKDIVEGQVQQGLIFRAATLHHGGQLRGQGLSNQLRQSTGAGGGIGRRLEHRAVSGGQGADQRHQGQLDRVVPWGQDEHRAVGLRADRAPGRKVGQRGGDTPGAGPAAQML